MYMCTGFICVLEIDLNVAYSFVCMQERHSWQDKAVRANSKNDCWSAPSACFLIISAYVCALDVYATRIVIAVLKSEYLTQVFKLVSEIIFLSDSSL